MTPYDDVDVATGGIASDETSHRPLTDGGTGTGTDERSDEPDGDGTASTDADGAASTDADGAASTDADGAASTDEEDTGSTSGTDATFAVLLDVMPQGLPSDDRPQYKKSPVAYGLSEKNFRTYQLTLTEEADVSVGDRVKITPDADSDVVSRYREVELADLTRNADAELEYAVEAIVEEQERRFVDFYNEAGPVTLRLHQLNLLPGIGKKLRDDILDERKRRGPFGSFDDVEERISGLHSPREVIVERILEELRDDDVKYKNFVGVDP